ncbi:MAG: Mur ligase family protein [Thermoleophilia bacterium]
MNPATRPPLPEGPCLVAGLGRAGRAAADALLRAGRPVSAWDASRDGTVRGAARRLRARGVAVALGGDGLDALASAGPRATIVKSPGIALDAALLRAARARGSEVIDELELGWRLCGAPVAAVTGTNGKSTTSRLCREVLQRAAGTALLAGNTEFGPALSEAVCEGWIVCETSSFQLEASPSFRPDVAVLTNLTPEHLDRHRSMAAYGAAKRAMFVAAGETAGMSVVNLDDPFGRALADEVRAAGGRLLGYGRAAGADVRILDACWDLASATLKVRGPGGDLTLQTRLPGEHNAHNLAAALAVAAAVGLPGPAAAEALAGATPPPGRWQPIDEGQPFDVLVDYAHTPDGVRSVLEAVRRAVDARDGARVHTVLGPVGLRDDAKDSGNGRAAGLLSDRLVVTSGSTPCPGRLARIAALRRAAPDPARVEVVLDRAAARARAIGGARPGDAVVVLGLGDLRRQMLDAHTLHPHHDAAAARAALRSGAPAWS